MFSASRALALNISSGKTLPEIPELKALYLKGTKPRHGEVVMIVGRSGTQKSGFALWLLDRLGLPTLYFSADMSPFTASSRVASTRTGLTTEQVEAAMDAGEGEHHTQITEALAESKFTFCFDSPITFDSINNQLDAYVELYDEYPSVICFDNLMDFENAEADYTQQMMVMQRATELARETGATIFILHHASDKGWDAAKNPYKPPSRADVKNGMAEKPELCLGVALNPDTMEYHVATLKQRMGPSDPTGRNYATFVCDASTTSFHAYAVVRH